MRDRLSSSHRPKRAEKLAALAANNNNFAYIVTASMLVLFMAPVALGWQKAVQPEPIRNNTSSANVNEPAVGHTSEQELAEPSQPASGASSQVEASTVVNNNQASTQLKVNGKEITVPQNGTVNQAVPNASGGVTNVNVSTSSDSSGSNVSQSFTSIQTNSTSQSSTIVNNSQ